MKTKAESKNVGLSTTRGIPVEVVANRIHDIRRH